MQDNTTPPIVHFTREQMLNNGITLSGDDSDFAIITGENFEEGTTYDSEGNPNYPVYIYDNKIINKDVICQNGYIHQVKNVLVQPGNMAQIIGREPDTKYFSHILDYYKYAKIDPTTTNTYNAWVKQYPDLAAKNGYVEHDVYQVRYLSMISQRADGRTDPNGTVKSETECLAYDPGWNEYYPNSDKSSEDKSKITDMGTMFVPTDDAMWEYFKGPGAFIIKEYGQKPNTRENLLDNLDDVQNANPGILTSFVKNIQKTSFVSSTPSKFPEIINDASELLNMSVDSLIMLPSGRYDIKIANNGVIYKTHGVLAPDRYRSVLGPVCTYRNMKVMDWAVEEVAKSTGYSLGIDFQYYLLAMKANYAFFIPTDDAFGAEDAYYLDPASINWTTKKAKVLHFYRDPTNRNLRLQQYLTVRAYDIDLTSGDITTNTTDLALSEYWAQLKSALGDIMNYHTVVLDNKGDDITSGNKYYKTKHGGEVLVENVGGKTTVKSGSQISGLLPAASVQIAEKEENGVAYHMDHLIQPTILSVSQVLKQNPRFDEFYNLCAGFNNPDLLYWIGFSSDYASDPFKMSQQDRLLLFSNDYTYHSSENMNLSLAPEGNVKLFNTYNYTLYAPDNDAMSAAYAAGLPSWSDIDDIYQAVVDARPDVEQCPEPYATYLKEQVKRMREFCTYHFQYISLYADNSITASDGGGGRYQSMLSEDGQPPLEYTVNCSGGVLTLRDGGGQTHTISASDASQLSNLMARDYWLDKSPGSSNNSIKTSSFCVIHELKEPLHFGKAYNAGLTSCKATDIISALSKKRASKK